MGDQVLRVPEEAKTKLSWRTVLRGLVILALLSPTLVALASCLPNNQTSNGNGTVGIPVDVMPEQPTVPAAPSEPAHHLVTPLAQQPIELDPVWTLSFDRPVAAALSPDGAYVLVGRSYGSVRNPTQWGALAYEAATGRELWRKTFATGYRAIEVGLLGIEPQYTVSLFAYNGAGTLLVYDAAGKSAWSRSVTSSAGLVRNLTGTRVFGIDRGRNQVFISDAFSGRELAQVSTTMDATVQVSPTGQALIVSGTSLVLLSNDGRVLGRTPLREPFADVQFAPTGDNILATTGGGDSSVYRFDARGGTVWEQRVPGGGSNSLAISPDGTFAMAFNVGVDHGMVLLDAADGRVLYRNEFGPVEDAKGCFIRWVKFLPEGAGYLVDYAVARDVAGVHTEEHILLLFSLDGEVLARMDVGANVDVLVSDDGTTCVTVNTVPGEFAGTNRVRLYDIRPLLGPE